jgi:hypothetical protein
MRPARVPPNLSRRSGSLCASRPPGQRHASRANPPYGDCKPPGRPRPVSSHASTGILHHLQIGRDSRPELGSCRQQLTEQDQAARSLGAYLLCLYTTFAKAQSRLRCARNKRAAGGEQRPSLRGLRRHCARGTARRASRSGAIGAIVTPKVAGGVARLTAGSRGARAALGARGGRQAGRE